MKKYLFLDLDKTLIFSRKVILSNKKLKLINKKIKNNNRILKYSKKKEHLEYNKYNIILRPYLHYFLDSLKKYYILNIFTAASKEYCEMVTKKIEKKKKYFNLKLSNEHLINNVKRLDKLKKKDYRELNIKNLKDVQKRMILIDDKDKFIGEQKNAIQIKPFIGDKNDKTLLYFTIILKGMRVIEDTEEEIEYFKKAIKRANS